MGRRLTTAVFLLVVVLSFDAARAQAAVSDPGSIYTRQVTASASRGSIRFASLGELTEIRLEVIDMSGEVVFDSDFKPGNVIEWDLTDRQAKDGSYLCLVTVRDSSSHITRKQAVAILHNQSFSLKLSDRSILSSAQAQLAGTVEGEDLNVNILDPGASDATAVLGHDGKLAHLVSGSGGLSVSSGDFFANKVREQIRLTAEGNVGIGISNPQARLDVAGRIRVSEGIVFPDGSVQFSASRKTFGAASLSPGKGQQVIEQEEALVPDISGIGTTSKIPKWQDGPNGVLADSDIIDVPCTYASCIGIGVTPAPNSPFKLDVRGHNRFAAPNVSFYLTGEGNNEWVFQTVDADRRLRIFDNRGGGERLSISQTGNVGIGTATPAQRLDVSGTINTSTQYNIGGSRVLSVVGTNNIFAGAGAGAANTTGNNNSFFGRDAGLSNTTGAENSFFGTSAGQNNTTGIDNSFFGYLAGISNISGNANAFFGRNAGFSNTTACCNTFVGAIAGASNSTGEYNAFLGAAVGGSNTTGNHNSLVGAYAGYFNTSGSNNSFFGFESGLNNTTGNSNSFFGVAAGHSNISGFQNSFFGLNAGLNNTTGSGNSFFGTGSGGANTTGFSNAFFGDGAGIFNMTGGENSFVGEAAGRFNTTGANNAFFGAFSGSSNTTENNNTFIGYQSNGVAGITNATAIGAFAVVAQSNSLALGNNADVGIGTTAPKAKLHVQGGNVFVGGAGLGIILKSPDGNTCVQLSIDNSGNLVVTKIGCP